MELNLFNGIHMDSSMESKVDMPAFHMESSGVHGIRNWLGSWPTFIPWIPYGIPDGFHGFHMDSIWNNPGKVKTS